MGEISRPSRRTPGDAAAEASGIDSPRPAFFAPTDLLQIDALIASISAGIVKSSAKTLDGEILRSLRDFYQLSGIDRGGLIAVWEDSPVVMVSHAWYGEGVPQVPAEINLAELYPWSYRQTVIAGEVLAIERLEDFPPEAEVDRQTHFIRGTKSTLTIPLFIGSRVHHLIAAGVVGEHRQWDDAFIVRLRLLGEIFVSALQRREDELALRQAKDRLDLAASAAGACLWELDFDSGCLWASDTVRDLFGFAAEPELTLPRFLEVVHAEDRAMLLEAIDRIRRTGTELKVEYRVPAADGQIRWMHSRGRCVAEHPATPPRLMGVTQEVTREKLLEQQMQAQLREIDRLREQLQQENTWLRNEMAVGEGCGDIIGASGSLRAIMAQVEQVARTGCTVLIQGETGTGKELIAQTVHRLSARSKKPLIKVNCAALPAALVESELFGREKGAFTGALSRQVGRFELADGSTLFLDEIAEMPLETQAKLLRVLQEGEFERLGSPRTLKVDVRVIAATNRDLAEEVEQGRFRRDLFYRLNVFPIQVPPLRERPEDIPTLVWEFVHEFGERMGKKIRRIAASDMKVLVAHSWPGNIRELRNVIEHAMIVSQNETLEMHQLVSANHKVATSTNLEEVERLHIQSILKATHGRIKGSGGAAEQLGLNPSTLYSRMRKLGINPIHP